MNLLADLRDRLAAEGVTAPIALSRIPDAPDRVITLRAIPAGPSRDLDGRMRPVLERHAVQLIARVNKDAGHAAADAIAWGAYRALVGKHLTINGRRYDWITATSVPAQLGRDENDRPLSVVKFDIQTHGDLT
jgi:hypothetical protein